jgi:hypothetical protein
MREDLLGYLLSALEPHEMRQVERALQSQPALREELEYLQKTLEPLDQATADLPVIETPSDLVARTLANLPALELGVSRVSPSFSTLTLSPASDGRRSLRRTWSDLLVASLASAAVLGILIPSIARERYEARKIACQEHLRQLGTAITQFVMQDEKDSLPQIAQSGPEAFAGIYAVRLADHDLLNEADLKWCPEVDGPGVENPGVNASVDDTNKLVKLSDLRRASSQGEIEKLQYMQQTAGGHYSYSLGVVDGDRYVAPQYESRSTFAVLGDTPISGLEVADGVNVEKLKWGHGDSGANLLFEDGSVRFMDMSRAAQFPDHPFFNHRGSFEAGVNVDDASLAPSWRAPFISVRQR